MSPDFFYFTTLRFPVIKYQNYLSCLHYQLEQLSQLNKKNKK